uniref:Uncharacterized protein n=1 Tax=Panagrellus redivivus TaxID=6233 RepID=A0A7E4VH86_PANRE
MASSLLKLVFITAFIAVAAENVCDDFFKLPKIDINFTDDIIATADKRCEKRVDVPMKPFIEAIETVLEMPRFLRKIKIEEIEKQLGGTMHSIKKALRALD